MTHDSVCALCHNDRATVVIVDADKRERAVCTYCWGRLERRMAGVRVLHFYGEPGRAT